MTSGEIKFALSVEGVLNRIPDPEYRQLMVESLMVLTIIAENQGNVPLGPGVVNVEQIVRAANETFIKENVKKINVTVPPYQGSTVSVSVVCFRKK